MMPACCLVLIAPEFALAPSLEAEWLASLPAARRTQVRAWTEPRARHRSLLGSRLLAEGLRRLGHPAASALASLRYPMKPSRSRPTLTLPLASGVASSASLGIEFSISHCDGRVACAVSTGGSVGVDVEAIGDLVAGAFKLYLSPVERAWAGRSPERFHTLWTRKEAVVKAAGSRGLTALQHVDTTLAVDEAELDGRRWWTPSLPIGSEHVGHLALADRDVDVTLFDYVPVAPHAGAIAAFDLVSSSPTRLEIR